MVQGRENNKDYFFIKSDNKIEQIKIEDVLYIEGMANYIVIHTKERKFITYLTFKGLQQGILKDNFVRIHKSYLVSISKIKTIQNSKIIVGEIELPLSRSFRDELMKTIDSVFFKR